MVAQLDPLKLEPGQRVDGWHIVRRIGSGGYAVVYEVEKDGQRFALKVACQTERSSDPRQVDARARREVACLQQLNHPHIIRMWAHGRWPDPRSGFLYIVLDLVDGYTLARWVEQTHPTPHEVVVLFRKLFAALEHMHSRDVFHRDLSLNNILVTTRGEPVIIDFGAADFAAAEDVTDGPLPPGTPRNRSPEAVRFWNENRLQPEARYTFRATDDIFALGADLYDVLTDPTPARSGKRPPLGHEVMVPPSPHKVTQGRVPLELSTYAMRLIRHRPAERYATAKDARGALEEFARFEGPEWHQTRVHPVVAQLPPASAEATPLPAARAADPSSPRRAWLGPVLAGPLALTVLAAAVAVFMLHRPAIREPLPVAQNAPATPLPTASAPAEKPTSRPSQLPSVLPTQQEANPSVKQADNSPSLTRGTSNPQELASAGPRRALSKAERCALLIASVAWFQAGCSGVQTRPGPAPCPADAIKAMDELGWSYGDNAGPMLLIDESRGGLNHPRPLLSWKEGPVTGAEIDFTKRPRTLTGIRFDGHLWITEDRLYGRYVRAHLPGGRTVPICLELTDSSRFGVPLEKDDKSGARVHDNLGETTAVVRWGASEFR